MSSLRKGLLCTAMGLVLMGTASYRAEAGPLPQFTLDPTALGGTGQVTGDTLTPLAAALITMGTNASSFSATSDVQITGIQLNGGAVSSKGLAGGVASDATWSLYFVLNNIQGTFSGALSNVFTYNLTNVDFTVYGVAGGTVIDNAGSTTTAPTVTPSNGTNPTGNTPVVLGAGDLKSGTAGFAADGGLFFNAILNFGTCTGNGTTDLGANSACTSNESSFFVSPVPFYTLAFSALNEDSQNVSDPDGVICTLQKTCSTYTGLAGAPIGVKSEGGSLTFAVPEPTSLALLGAALAGMGGMLGRRKRRAGGEKRWSRKAA